MTDVLAVINCGSSSVKAALYPAAADRAPLVRTAVHDIDGDYDGALALVIERLRRPGARLVAAGHRVVHGGALFTEPVVVDERVLARIESLAPLAPLHQPHNVAGMRALARVEPALFVVACFDTAFHRTMPAPRRTFALPPRLTEVGVRPYGFHGINFESIAVELPRLLGPVAEGRVVVLHLGNGVSLCALVRRRSVATTMTFTPLDGVPMSTRSGAIDPAVVLFLLREQGLSAHEVSALLHRRSGLAALSGTSGDVRELLAAGTPEAAAALEHFVDRIGLALGAMAAAAGGLDAVVFTGGIGENQPLVRERVAAHAAWLGVDLDHRANAAGGPLLTTERSRVSAWVIPAREDDVIARHTRRLYAGALR